MGRHRGTSHRWRGPVAAGGATVLVLGLVGLFVGRATAGGPDPIVAGPVIEQPCLGPCHPVAPTDPTTGPTTTAAPPVDTGTPTATTQPTESTEPTEAPDTQTTSTPTSTPTTPSSGRPSHHPTHTPMPTPGPPGHLDPPEDLDPLVDIDVETWDGGFNSQVSITNRSDDPVTWWIELRYADAEVHDSWNALVRITDDGLVATGEHDDFTIEPGQTVTFGFTATGTTATPLTCSLNGDTCDLA